MPNKKEVMERMGLEKETFDYALPQPWVNEVRKHVPIELKDEVAWHFVWLYDEKAKVFGRPCSLSVKGNTILCAILARPELYLGGKFFTG